VGITVGCLPGMLYHGTRVSVGSHCGYHSWMSAGNVSAALLPR